MKSYFKIFLAVLLGNLVLLSSCVQDDEFSTPPIVCTDNITANTPLADMAFFNTSDGPTEITTETIFEGYVVSSDAQGNFFSTLILQDALENPTRGLQVEIDVSNLYTQFPVGSKVIVNAQGLFIDDDTGTLEVGATFDDDGTQRVGRISEVNFTNHVFRSCNDVVTPTPVVYNNIVDALQAENLNTLITLNNVQFADVCDENTYYDENNDLGGATNVTLVDSQGNTISVRNSAFADFADEILPTGSGSITGVLSAFDTNNSLTPSDYQIFIRDTNDVNMTSDRFSTLGTRMNIADVRALFSGSTTTIMLDEDMFVQGTVISDRTNGSITGRNLVLQDDTAGIVVRFEDNNTYDRDQVISIPINGVELSAFNGLLQLNNVDLGTVEQECNSASALEPTIVSIADVLTGNYESQLVTLENVMFNPSGDSFAGAEMITDGTNTVTMFTRSNFTDLASQVTPSGSLNITAIGSNFNGPQLNPRDIEEVGGVAPTGETIIPFTENFTTGIPTDWIIIATTGDRVWEADDFGENFYAEMSAFAGSGNPIVDSFTWMITNELDFDAQSGEMMTLQIADAFSNGNPLEVYYSTDFTGSGNPANATWTRIGENEIDALNENTGTFDNNFEETAAIDLSSISGQGYIAIVYNSNGGTISSTIQIGQVSIQ